MGAGSKIESKVYNNTYKPALPVLKNKIIKKESIRSTCSKCGTQLKMDEGYYKAGKLILCGTCKDTVNHL